VIRALLSIAAVLIASPAISGALADGACKTAVDRTMGLIDGLLVTDPNDANLMSFSNKDGIGGALFLAILQIRTDPVLRRMNEYEKRRAAYNVCMAIYTPYFALSRPGQ